MNTMIPGLIGQSLFYNATAYYTSWVPVGGANGCQMTVELLAVFGSGTLTVTVETKKSNETDNTINATSWGSGSLNTAATHSWKAGQEIGDGSVEGFNDLVRLKIAIGGTVTADGIHFRVLAPQWLG